MGSAKAVVYAGSRLHIGFTSLPPRENAWASIGVYIGRPGVKVGTSISGTGYGERTRVHGLPPRLAGVLALAMEEMGLHGREAHIRVLESPPRHRGFGSTTQLLLASLHAIVEAAGGTWDPYRAARALGRGSRSEAGVVLYDLGGIVVLPARGLPPPVVIHKPPPPDWRAVMVLPGASSVVPEGEVEERLVGGLPPAPSWVNERLEETMLDVVRALKRDDVSAFTEAVCRIDRLNGEYFSTVQGGVVRPDVAGLVSTALEKGVCLAQSSWGPLLYTFTDTGRVGVVVGLLEDAVRESGVTARVWVSGIRGPAELVVHRGSRL